MTEFELLDTLKSEIPKGARGLIGIDDDAGILKTINKKRSVVCTDAIVDGVDFKSSEIKPENIGRKALAINLSDLAAMGARPVAFVLTLGFPKNTKKALLQRVYRGLFKLAKQYRVECLGGDLTQAKQLFISVTLIGEIDSKQKGIQRNGARVGDSIWVTGSFGGSILKKHYAFQPRVSESLYLSSSYPVHSMIDVSDGLVQDLGHVLRLSKMGAQLNVEDIPVSKGAIRTSKNNSHKSLVSALTDGEDFELLFTLSSRYDEKLKKAWQKKFPRTKLSKIGIIQKGKPRLEWRLKGESIKDPTRGKKGYDHFR